MFIAVPYSADLHISARAYVTYAVCAICLAVQVIGIDIESLMYYPDSWNPVKMLVSSVSHAGWGHIIGNLIFFLAFSPAVEAIVGREEISEELEDAIEYARSQRQDATAGLTYSGSRGKIDREIQAREATRAQNDYMSQLYQLVQADSDSKAVLLFLEDYELQKLSVEIYEELFDRMKEWDRRGRAMQCLGRLCIQLSLEKNDYRNAISRLLECQAMFTANFVICEADKVLILAWRLIDMGHGPAAMHLIQDAGTRCGDAIDVTKCKLLEIEILAVHLNELDLATSKIRELLSQKSVGYRDEIFTLAKRVQLLAG